MLARYLSFEMYFRSIESYSNLHTNEQETF